MSACMAVECLRRDLTENLENHVKGERRIGLDWGGISLHEYQKRERSTRERYSSHVDVETIERVKREVEATVFAYSRRQVEKCFRDLSGTAHEQYEACRSMFSQLFQPLANEMSQDAADWFSSLGGVSKLMPLLQKTYSDFCSSNWEDQDLESLCLVALKAMKCYASDDERLLIAYDHGMLDMIIDVLCKAKTGQTKYECGKLSCTFLDDKVCQVKFVHSGAFRPLLDMASDPTTLLYVVDSIIAGITCCAVNAAVLDSMIEHDVAGRFFYLAQDIYKLHRHELSGNVFMFRGINMISLLPLHISYLCYVGISLLLHQRSWRHWLELMNTVRQTGRPSSYDAVKSTLKAMPLSDKDEEMLQAVKLFISETNPNQVRMADKDRYIWPVFTPFTCLLQSQYPQVREMGAFALANLCQGDENRDTMRDEDNSNGFDLLHLTVTCGQNEGKDAKMDKTYQLSMQALSYATPDDVRPPKLQTICMFYISNNFYSRFSYAALQCLPLHLLQDIVPFEI